MAVNVVIGLGAMAVSLVLFWVWAIFTRMRLHRLQEPPKSDPQTMELRDETPAVVNFLTHDLRLEGDALAATVLDLAARDHLDIVELSPEQNFVVPRHHDRAGLKDYERCVLDVVERAAGDQPHATVPAIVAALGPGSANQWLAFKHQVENDAFLSGLMAKGRSVSKLGWLMLLSLMFSAGMVLCLPPLVILVPGTFLGYIFGGLFIALRGRTKVLTPAGRAAAAHWGGVRDFVADHGNFDDLPPAAVELWDRYLAYAVAMGLSEVASRGVVTELRTRMSMSDVRGIATGIHTVYRAMHDPAASRQYRTTQLTAAFGEGADPDAIYGPASDDFWTLLDHTGKGLRVAMLTIQADRALWQRASEERLDALIASAPPELADDVRTVADAAHQWVDAVAAAGSSTTNHASLDLADNRAFKDPAFKTAADRLVKAVAARRGVQPTGAAVYQSLTGLPAMSPRVQ